MVLERDVGEGPSTLPLVQAHIRVRPITVRFTEPGVRDLELKLHTIPSLHPFVAPLSNTQHPQQHQQQQRVIFDFDFDTQHQDSHLLEQSLGRKPSAMTLSQFEKLKGSREGFHRSNEPHRYRL